MSESNNKLRKYYFSNTDDHHYSWLYLIEIAIGGKEIQVQALDFQLPGYVDTIWTAKRFGTQKSYTIHRNYEGESTFNFYMDRLQDNGNSNNSSELFKLYANSFMAKGPHNVDTAWNQHREFDKSMKLDHINIKLLDRNFVLQKQYKLLTPLITEFKMGELGYDSEEIIKSSMTVHYDFWHEVEVKDGEVKAGISVS